MQILRASVKAYAVLFIVLELWTHTQLKNQNIQFADLFNYGRLCNYKKNKLKDDSLMPEHVGRFK